MNVTRDVILDLVPLYLAGEASRDTEALVNDYLAADPALAAWVREQRASLPADFGPPLSSDVELRTLKRVRHRVVLQRWVFGIACFFIALTLSAEFTTRAGRLVEFHFLARDHPAAALACLALALACFALHATLRQRRFALVLLVSITAHAVSPVRPAEAQAPREMDREFRIDAGHSTVEFEIPFMYGHVRGRFDDVAGTIVLPDSGRRDSVAPAVAAVIRTKSLNTGSSHRDEHLRSSDFFDADRYPVIMFRSERVERTPDGFTLVGPLSMHGRTRSIRIPCRIMIAPTSDVHHVIVAIFSGAVTVNRLDFDILGGSAHNDWFDRARSVTMGDSVRISLEIHGTMADPANPSPYTRATIARIDSIGIDSAVARLRSAFTRDSAAFTAGEAGLDVVGRTLLDIGRTRDGFLWLHTIARLRPASSNAMVSVGLSNQRMGDLVRARAWYDRAVAADSLDARATARLAILTQLAP